MTILAAILQVPDYDRMRSVLQRAAASGSDYRIEVLRAADDPDEVMLLVHCASVERATELMSDSRLSRAFLDQAGLEEYPPLFVGDVVDVFGSPTDRTAP